MAGARDISNSYKPSARFVAKYRDPRVQPEVLINGYKPGTRLLAHRASLMTIDTNLGGLEEKLQPILLSKRCSTEFESLSCLLLSLRLFLASKGTIMQLLYLLNSIQFYTV